MSRIFYIIVLILLCFLVSAWTQETVGHLEGHIHNDQGEAISSVNIVVTSPQLQGERGASTNNDGYFRILALPAGFYTVKISHIAHKSTIVQKLPIRLGKTTSLGDINLHSRVIELPEVEVSGERPIIDPQSTTIGANLQHQIIDQLPVQRNFRAVAELIPQANTSYYEHFGEAEQVNISGSTGQANAYYIDGVNATDGSIALGSTDLPYNFIQEIEIKTGGYQAEYGRSLGGIINVITPSGGNEFHGQVFGFFSNNKLGGDPKITLDGAVAEGFSSYDCGFSLGGPIIPDRLWFHTAYNPNFEQQKFRVPVLGVLRDSRVSHLFAGKLTWRAPGNTDIVLSLFGDPSFEHKNDALRHDYTIINKDVLARQLHNGGTNLSLQARRTFGQKLLLTAHISHISESKRSEAETEHGSLEPLFVDVVNGAISGGVGQESVYLPQRLAGKVSASLFLGKHDLKIGMEYEDNRLDGSIDRPRVVIRTADSTYQMQTYLSSGVVNNRVSSLFLQDSWQTMKRLRLNVGVRWDGQYFIGSARKLNQRITSQFQPRMGVIYQLGVLGSAKLFASYGRFYEQIPTLFSFVMHNTRIFKVGYYDHNPIVDPSGGDIWESSSSIQPEVKDLQGQFYDEFILGYERRIGNGFKIAIRGIYRTLGQAVDTGIEPETYDWIYGNPGRGNLDFFPKYSRTYRALEVFLQRSMGKRFNFITSYVLSRNHGNYTGLYNAETNKGLPNFSDMPSLEENIPNSEGLLPNDRTHVFKFSGSYRSDIGLTLGVSFLWQSGTPITELGSNPWLLFTFLSERGSVGRTPTIADLNFRLRYDFSNFAGKVFKPALVLDAFHVFNQRQAVRLDQTHYYLDNQENLISTNPNYLNPTDFFPARMIRVGMEINF